MSTHIAGGIQINSMLHSRRLNYLVIIWLTVSAVIVTSVLLRMEGTAFYSFLLIAIVVAAALSGLRAAVFALTLSVLASVVLLMRTPAPDRGQHDLMRLVFFAVSAISASLVVELLRKSRARVRVAEQKLAIGIEAAALRVIEWEMIPWEDGWCPELQAMLATLEPQSASALLDSVEQALVEIGEFECELQTKMLSGLPDWLLFKGRLQRTSSSRVRLVGALVDITIHKRAEHERRRSIQLAATARVTQELAHEINNPLCALMFTFFLLQTSVPAGEKKWHDLMTRAQAELCRVASLTEKILLTSEAEKME